jgi:hypothetical protein
MAREAGVAGLALLGGLVQLALAVWALILFSRLVTAVERTSEAYRESLKNKS